MRLMITQLKAYTTILYRMMKYYGLLSCSMNVGTVILNSFLHIINHLQFALELQPLKIDHRQLANCVS